MLRAIFLFPQCLQKACFLGASKGVIVWEWVKSPSMTGPSFSSTRQFDVLYFGLTEKTQKETKSSKIGLTFHYDHAIPLLINHEFEQPR